MGSEEIDELTALRIISAGEDDSGKTEVYDFYVNVDNKYLRIVEKESADDPKLVKAKFVYGLVLIGLALLQDQRTVHHESSDEEHADSSNIEKVVEVTTRAIAPVLLPMLESIGSLDVTDED